MSNAFAALEARILAVHGLRPRRDWPQAIPRGLEALAGEESTSAGEVLRRLSDEPALLDRLMAYLTVGETHFYRHARHFDRLVNRLAERAGDDSPITLWSAGCASGEEPYSMAIALAARFGRGVLGRVRILANDLSNHSVERARRAEYGAWSFRGTPAWVLAHYFREGARGKLSLEPEIRKAVSLRHASIEAFAAEQAAGSLEVIFFRNVGIYLDPSALERIFRALHRALAPGGLLMIAPSDPRPPATLFTSLEDAGTIHARRQEVDARAEAPRGSTVSTVTSSRTPSRSRRPWESEIHRRPLPAAPAPSAPATPAPAPAKVEVGLDPLAEIERMGDAGEIDAALALLTRLIEADPTAAEALSIRGRMHVSRGAHDAAIADLRQALFIDPDHHLARYWYALALSSGGAPGRALGQLRDLQQRIATRDPEDALEDGLTTAGDLRSAITALEARFR
ncbi:MAG: tetratricopeptide repeat protein [Deltaproteobacteria bacterium]|nr:tetratricopeptide repeat protein [Deltaproteobacteria bacterium]